MKAKRIEVHSGPDGEGKYHYTLFWMATYHPGDPKGEYRTAERAQCFHAELRCVRCRRRVWLLDTRWPAGKPPAGSIPGSAYSFGDDEEYEAIACLECLHSRKENEEIAKAFRGYTATERLAESPR